MDNLYHPLGGRFLHPSDVRTYIPTLLADCSLANTHQGFCHFWHILIAADLNKLNDANAQPLITGAKVGNCLVPYTYKQEEQKLIADYLDSACSRIDEVLALKQQQLVKMQQYKKSLIYEYVTGKKRVAEVN